MHRNAKDDLKMHKLATTNNSDELSSPCHNASQWKQLGGQHSSLTNQKVWTEVLVLLYYGIVD